MSARKSAGGTLLGAVIDYGFVEDEIFRFIFRNGIFDDKE